MKYFKVSASRTAERYLIERDVFEKITKRKYPFVQVNNRGERSQYGICPSCLNPIQLIGISHEIQESPHGRHAGKDIDGLPSWNYQRYKYCPYASFKKRAKPNREEKLEIIDDNIAELYNLLREEFDRVVYVLESGLEIKCSNHFWRKALNQFVVNQDYLYPWLTESNLPYIFAYFGVHLQSAYKQRILVDSEIYNALSICSKICLVKCEKDIANKKYAYLESQQGTYFSPQFRFYSHGQKANEGQPLTETMKFCIDDRDTGKTTFERVVEFDETFFCNLIRKDNKKNRRYDLLDIANEIMQPLDIETPHIY